MSLYHLITELPHTVTTWIICHAFAAVCSAPARVLLLRPSDTDIDPRPSVLESQYWKVVERYDDSSSPHMCPGEQLLVPVCR